MNKEDQKSFYKRVGQKLTDERRRRNMSIAALAKQSGEQNRTIRWIEAGNCHSMHHAVWMKSVLGIDINEIIREGISGEVKRIVRVDDII